MARLSDDVKENWEDETLALFMNHRRETGGPNYEFVRRRERPDRVIRVVGSTEEIGVEITRCVAGGDAAAEQRIVTLAEALRREPSAWERGGWIHLLGGDFPDCGEEAVDRLVVALHNAVAARGSLSSFCDSLDDGGWEHERTRFLISSDPDEERWHVMENHLSARPGRRAVCPTEIDRMLLDRVRDKARKAPSYGWTGPLVLLVRNPYRVHSPDARAVEEAERLLRPVFREAWLVNHVEGALDISPPDPRLVPLVPS